LKDRQRNRCAGGSERAGGVVAEVDLTRPAAGALHPPAQGVGIWIAQGSVTEQVRWLLSAAAAERFQLVYCDPPFFSNQDKIGDAGRFGDCWPDLDTYLAEMRAWLQAMACLVAPTGFFVLHCDYHASHYLKVTGDAVFGYRQFRNEWIWHYTGRRQPARQRVSQKHDTLLVWAKGPKAVMNPVFEPWDREHYVRMKRQKVYRDETGREWIWGHQGRGRSHAYRIYLDEQVARGRAIDSVWDIPMINTSAKERTGYPTQKPVRLLQRVVQLTAQPGQWVADLAAGSGTTGVAAVSEGCHVWLGDHNPEAISLIRQRVSLSAGAAR
jgi:site-specific DNA-methyltransferase (adenine-specific)